VLVRLRKARVDLGAVIDQHHPWGVFPLRRRPLRLYEMTARKGPFAGIVTAPKPPPQDEVQRRVVLAIGKASYSWPPS
jgi:hypothetical protein